MKVVLVQPRIGYMDALRTSPSPPLGLLSAAAWLAQHYEVELVDLRLGGDGRELVGKALTEDTLFVGITCHTGPMIAEALRISHLVKQLSAVPVVWGGVHASLQPEATAAHPDIDACVIGEGEQTCLELARALERGGDLRDVAGLSLKVDDRVVLTPPRRQFGDDWPDPAYQLIDLRNYLPRFAGKRSLFVQASRGCPYRCSYCYNVPFNARRLRKRPVPAVLDLVARQLERTPFEDVYLVDDNALVDRRWFFELASGLGAMGLSWQIQGVDIASLLHMSRAELERLAQLGCSRLTIGVETGSDRMRRLIHKQGSRQDVVEAVSRLEGLDILVFASFMVGLPGETLTDMRATVDLMFQLVDRFDFLRCSPVYCYTPFPGTEAYELACSEGFQPPADLAGWARLGGWDNFSWERRSEGRVLGRRFFEGLNMSTLFLDDKAREYSASPLLRWLYRLYRPVARFRARNFFFHLMPELTLLHRLYDRQSGVCSS